MERYVFDTGALIGAERRKQRALEYLAKAKFGRARIVTPVVCVIEWWRGRSDARDKILETVVVEPLLVDVAKTAGEALTRVHQRVDARLTIDAAVAAHAALREAPLITSDPDDFDAFREFFRGLRVLSV
jgi:predicted nucleic acid-binding protein